MEDTISQAKAEFSRAKERLIHVLATTPDDKINWSPSPTARTPIQQVGHAAAATIFIKGMLTNKALPWADFVEAVTSMRGAEKSYTSREQVLGLLDQSSADYLVWLDTLTPEQVASTVSMPFGPMPMAIGITLPADHIRSHTAQSEYIQTTYGDLDWHM